jgi:hypothetical protein
MTEKVYATQEKKYKLDFIEIETFVLQRTLSRNKRRPRR